MAGITQLLASAEQLLSTVHPELQFAVGERELDRHSTPPRIVWIVNGASHSAAEKIKGSNRSVLTRGVDVIAHVWATNLETLEELVDDTIAALYRVAHGSIQFGGEEWPATDDAHYGLVALIRFAVSAPVVERKFVHMPRANDDRLVKVTPEKVETQYLETDITLVLPMSALWRDFDGGSWDGAASIAIPGSRVMVPAFGGATVESLNGRKVASFSAVDGGGDDFVLSGHFQSDFAIEEIIGASSFSTWCLAKVAAPDDAYVSFLRDDGDNFQLSAGVPIGGANTHALIWSTSLNGYVDAPGSLVAGQWTLIQCRHNGSSLSLRMNGGPWSTVPSGPVEDLSEAFSIGFGAAMEGAPLAFSIAELGTSKECFDDAIFDSIREYVSNRYALSV